jgi:hypothetical protein
MLRTSLREIKQTACPFAALCSGRKTFPRQGINTEISPLRFPGFPVEFRGVDEVLAPLFAESRMRGHG